MRVSTRGAFLNGLSLMQQLQTALDRTQRQIASGRRILTPSDDPIAASRSLEIRESLSRLQQFDRNGTIAQNRLSLEESALSSVNNVLQRVRELALQANNATQSNETRGLIAIEMREHLDHLVQLANTRDGNGRHMFSGHLEDVETVTRMGSVFTYNGDQGQRLIQIGEGREVADGDPGSDVFFGIRDGNGVFSVIPQPLNAGTGVIGVGSTVDPTQYDQDQYTVTFIGANSYEVRDSSAVLVTSGSFQPGDTLAFRGIEFALTGQPAAGDEFIVAPSSLQDVFSIVESLASAIEQPVYDDSSRTLVTNQVNAGILGIDQALTKTLDVRTQVGSRLAAIENQIDTNGAYALTYRETLASIEDLDYAEALSHLSLVATTLEAAQQSFVRTQQLSLFNYF